jgi:hypothetical protein
MRSLTLLSLCLLTACGAAEVQSQRLKDGSLQISCELSMDECIRRVQDQCKNQRYRILEGTSETRLRDAPPFEKAYHTSRLHLTCTNDGANPLLSFDKPAAEPAAEAAAAASCTAGETRTCVGPAACKGGQACLPDGKGFGPCDCGPSVAPPAPPAPEGAPDSTPGQAVTPPATSPGDQQNPAAK